MDLYYKEPLKSAIELFIAIKHFFKIPHHINKATLPKYKIRYQMILSIKLKISVHIYHFLIWE